MRGFGALRTGIALGWMLAFGGAMLGQSAGAVSATPAAVLLVLAKKDEALAIVDPATLQVLARVPVGPEPHEVIASADGKTAWVSNYRNGSEHTITVVDLVAQKVTTTLDLGPLRGPHGLYFADGKTWFTAERAKVVGRIDPATEKVDWVMGTGQVGTHMVWVSRDGKKVVTVNVGSGTMSLMSERAAGAQDAFPGKLSKQGGVTKRDGVDTPEWEERVVKVGGYPEGFDVLADAAGDPKTVWVANAVEGTIGVVDFETGSVVKTLDVGLKTANRLRFTPDGRLALLSREKSGEVAVVEVATGRVVKEIAVGTGAAGVLIAPDGKRAYLSCSPDNWVAVVDLQTMTVVGKVMPGTMPDGLAWAVR